MEVDDSGDLHPSTGGVDTTCNRSPNPFSCVKGKGPKTQQRHPAVFSRSLSRRVTCVFKTAAKRLYRQIRNLFVSSPKHVIGPRLIAHQDR
jgi:hypothetical protein